MSYRVGDTVILTAYGHRNRYQVTDTHALHGGDGRIWYSLSEMGCLYSADDLEPALKTYRLITPLIAAQAESAERAREVMVSHITVEEVK